MATHHRITLTEEEVAKLENYGSKGIRKVRLVLYARSLLLMDRGPHTQYHWTLEQTAQALGLSTRALNNLRKKFVEQGFSAVFVTKPSGKSKRPRIFDRSFEAQLAKLCQEEPPEGHSRWTVRLLAEKLIQLKIVDSVSTMTVQRALKKMKIDLNESV